MNNIKFLLNGCDISFYAEAPGDMTLKELLVQCDRIKPDYCACGICSSNHTNDDNELLFTYDNVIKTRDNVSCSIQPSQQVQLSSDINIDEFDNNDDWTTKATIAMGR